MLFAVCCEFVGYFFLYLNTAERGGYGEGEDCSDHCELDGGGVLSKEDCCGDYDAEGSAR